MTLVRLVVIADFAIGVLMLSILPRCLSVALFQSMSSRGDPLLAVKPFSDFLRWLAPASLYPLFWGRAAAGFALGVSSGSSRGFLVFSLAMVLTSFSKKMEGPESKGAKTLRGILLL